MCLLIVKPAGKTFTNLQLRDMYSRNKDGFGVMYAENNTLFTDKDIGTVDQWIEFFRKHEDREACFHLRMQTHGDIDLTNAHPYPVFNFQGVPKADIPVAMMHNGILHTGNDRDKSKSDTWHYIRNIIHPLAKNDAEIIFTEAFRAVLEKHIGTNNKFAFMDHKGRTQVVNRDAGIEWEGSWFSNTYAWSASSNTLYPGISKRTYPAYPGYTPGKYDSGRTVYGRGGDMWDDEYSGYPVSRASKPVTAPATPVGTSGVKPPAGHNPARNTPMETAGVNKHTTTTTPALQKPADTPTNPVRVAKGTDLPGKSSGKKKEPAPVSALNGDGKSVLLDQHGNSMVVGPNWLPPGSTFPKDDIGMYEGVSTIYLDDVRYAMGLLRDHTTISGEVKPTQIESLLRRFGPTAVSVMFEDALFCEDAESPSHDDLKDMILDESEAKAYFDLLAGNKPAMSPADLNKQITMMVQEEAATLEAAAIISEMRKEEAAEDTKLAEDAKQVETKEAPAQEKPADVTPAPVMIH